MVIMGYTSSFCCYKISSVSRIEFAIKINSYSVWGSMQGTKLDIKKISVKGLLPDEGKITK